LLQTWEEATTLVNALNVDADALRGSFSVTDAFGGGGGSLGGGVNSEEERRIVALQELQDLNMEATKVAVDLGKAARERREEAMQPPDPFEPIDPNARRCNSVKDL